MLFLYQVAFTQRTNRNERNAREGFHSCCASVAPVAVNKTLERGLVLGVDGGGTKTAALLVERDGQVLGAAEALLKAFSSTWWPADRVEYERNLATIRAALSEEAFAAAWAKGQAMTQARAIADASKQV